MRLKWILFVGFLLMMAVPALAQDFTATPELDVIVLEKPLNEYELAQTYNICIEDFLKATGSQGSSAYSLSNDARISAGTTFKKPADTLPCYDEHGYRLKYYDELTGWLKTPVRSSLKTYAVQRGDSWATITRHFNICQSDFLRINKEDTLLYVGRELFIPDDFYECYDRVSGTRWIYTHGDSRSHRVPSMMPSYMLQPDETLLKVAHKLNICIERLREVNPGKIDYPHSEIMVPIGEPSCYLVHQPYAYVSVPVVSSTPTPPMTLPQEILPVMATLAVMPTAVSSIATFSPLPTAVPILPKVYQSPLDIARQYNVCFEALRRGNDNIIHDNSVGWAIKTFDLPVYIPLNEPPCYDEQGRRLRYQQGNEWLPEPERSHLKVYIFRPGDTLETVARMFNVCPHELVRENSYPLPAVDTEYFIPNHTPPCYDSTGRKLQHFNAFGQRLADPYVPDMPVVVAKQMTLQTISTDYNVCVDELIAANPEILHLAVPSYGYSTVAYASARQYLPEGYEVFVPQGTPQCYSGYYFQKGDTLESISERFNICSEVLAAVNTFGYNGNSLTENTLVRLPDRAAPCYENGKRMRYEQDGLLMVGVRSPLTPYRVQSDETLYDISLKFNVCVGELVKANPSMSTYIQTGNIVFIPDAVRPCYDWATSHSLIYEDYNGNPLNPPKISSGVIYEIQGWEMMGSLVSMFNICEARIHEANPWLKSWEVVYINGDYAWGYNRLSSRGGWHSYVYRNGDLLVKGDKVLIPVDKPHCHNKIQTTIYYICYAREVDFSQDYSSEALSFDRDGKYCYDLYDPKTLIWYKGQSYLLIYNHSGVAMLQQAGRDYYSNYSHVSVPTARIIMSLEFDVPYEVIVNATKTILPEMELVGYLSAHTLIPCTPSQPCYQIRLTPPEERKPADYTLHPIQYGETLRGIAWRYGKLPQWINDANRLENPDMIVAQEYLIIPGGINLWDMAQPAALVLTIFGSAAGLFVLMRLFRWRLRRAGRKRKNEAAA